jgi:hypothetical protein
MTATPGAPLSFDDIFRAKFMQIIQNYKDNPRTGPLTQTDRKAFIDSAYSDTDKEYFANRSMSDQDIKLRALTKVFYKVLAEEPWSDEWIRSPDVERKLSRFEMHKDSVELAAQHGLQTPRDAIVAARQHQIDLAKNFPADKPGPRGPYDDIEIIYIPGTVSSTATNRIDRDTIYPVSVSSVANILHTHICREMVRPFAMAEKFVTCTDTEELTKMRQFACDVVDYAPHLLDNDNVSLLIVLLILARSEICRRFENNGIRIEGSTISHRRAECMKTKLGWKTSDDRKPFDNVATELQTRVKNACFPAPRAQRVQRTKNTGRKSSTPATPATPATPPIGYFPAPSFPQTGMPMHYNNVHNVHLMSRPNFPNVIPSQVTIGPGSSVDDPMDLS